MLNNAKLVLAFEEYISSAESNKMGNVGKLDEVDQFEVLKSLYYKLFKPSGLAHANKISDDDITNVSNSDDYIIFTFTNKCYKCVNKDETNSLQKYQSEKNSRPSVYGYATNPKPRVPKRKESMISFTVSNKHGQ